MNPVAPVATEECESTLKSYVTNIKIGFNHGDILPRYFIFGLISWNSCSREE